MANEQTTGQSLKDLSNIDPDTLTELADSISSTELDYLDGVTAGTVTASKALVVDANKDLGDLRNVDATNIDAGLSGTAGSVDVFPTTAAKGKLTLVAADSAGDTTTSITNASHGQATVVTIPDSGLATSYLIQSTAAVTIAEADALDGATAGTPVASKVVVADANQSIGAVNATSISVGATGSEILAPEFVKLTETVGYAAFTDNANATGQFDLTAGNIPIGATLIASAVTAITGFTGDTTATMTIGDGTDVDRYNTGTLDVFTTLANGIATGVPSGVQYHDAAKTPRLTVTGGADFTSISAGSVTVEYYYIT